MPRFVILHSRPPGARGVREHRRLRFRRHLRESRARLPAAHHLPPPGRRLARRPRRRHARRPAPRTGLCLPPGALPV